MLEGLELRATAESDGPRRFSQYWIAFSPFSSKTKIGADVINETRSLQDKTEHNSVEFTTAYRQ